MVKLLNRILHIFISWNPFPELILWISILYSNIFCIKYLHIIEKRNFNKLKAESITTYGSFFTQLKLFNKKYSVYGRQKNLAGKKKKRPLHKRKTPWIFWHQKQLHFSGISKWENEFRTMETEREYLSTSRYARKTTKIDIFSTTIWENF